MKKSNCHLTAWKKFREGTADSLTIRYTKYSRINKLVSRNKYLLLLLKPFILLGILIQWISWPLIHVGEILRTGRWYHVTWREGSKHKEFISIEDKYSRWIPPIIFEGKEQEVPDEQTKHSSKNF